MSHPDLDHLVLSITQATDSRGVVDLHHALDRYYALVGGLEGDGIRDFFNVLANALLKGYVVLGVTPSP